MKNKILPYLLKYGPLLNLLVLLVLLAFIWIEVHWSVAVMMAWMAYSISSFATGLNKFKRQFNRKIKAVHQESQQNLANFDQFIGTVNKQAREFKKHGNKCIECEKYPGQIRHGSIHNSADPNCQMHMPQPLKAGDKIQVPPELLKEDTRPRCKKCKEEGLPDLHYHNNCPIHN